MTSYEPYFCQKKSTKYETIVEETFHLLLFSIILVGLFPYFSGFVLVLPVVSLEFVSVVSFLFVSAISLVLAWFRSFPFDGFVLRFGKFNVLTVQFRKTHSNSADLTCGFLHRAQG